MAEVIRMPKMSDTMEEGTIANWLKKEGDTVQAGDVLAEVETDKATMELEAYEDGTLLHIGIPEKAAAPVNGIIAIIGEQGEDISTLLQDPSPQQQPTAEVEAAAPPPSTRIVATPLAKKLAQAHGHDLATIQGTGPNGRIIRRDVEHPTASPTTPTTVTEREAYEDRPISSMRKTIAQRLTESKNSAPHFYLTVQISMDQLVAARPSLNTHVKLSFNDFIIKATALALRQHPTINVAWLGDKIRYHQHIHVGIAIAVDEGLLVPIVRFADSKSLPQIATEVKALRQKAQHKQLHPQDWAGSTFTISNLGMLGIESFTAIVNPPAACILAVGAIQETPVVRGSAIVPGHIMKATLSCDHRAVDGATGAAFLQTLKDLLESPLKMFIH